MADAVVATSAEDLRILGPLSAEASGRDLPVVYRRALLFKEENATLLAADVAYLNQSLSPFGLTLELSGPWPPYHFCPSLGPEGRNP